MSHYTQLTREQRYQIFALKKVGISQKAIAEEIGVNKSTISRELSRNTGLRGYRPKQAHEFALSRRADKVTPRIGNICVGGIKFQVTGEHDLMEEIHSDLLAKRLQAKAAAVIGDRSDAFWKYTLEDS